MENNKFETLSYEEQIKIKKENIRKMAESNATDTEKKGEFLADQVKVLSPSQRVFKRFFRSKLSMFGLITIIVLFLFSFIGPIFTHWGQVEDDKRPGAPVISEKIYDYYETFAEAEVPNNKVEENPGTKESFGYFMKEEL